MNDINQKIFSIEKRKGFFFHFHKKKPQILFQNSEDFFEVLHISVKNEDFRNVANKNAKLLGKWSNFVLQKCYAPQNNAQKNRHKSHV